jgi:hypothetical protein
MKNVHLVTSNEMTLIRTSTEIGQVILTFSWDITGGHVLYVAM